MLKVALFGLGHLGRIHLKCLQLLPEVYEIAGVFDPDPQVRTRAEEAGVPYYEDAAQLLARVDAVDIVTPTTTHFDLARRAIKAGKHVFIEKPLTDSVSDARKLVELSRQQGVKVQVGHVERFNPALLSLGDMEVAPMFVEAHRLAGFNPRGTDVSVVLDLMIHDLDIVLSLIDAPVTNVHATGVAVVSKTPDIANARLEFANGAVANLTASRISLKQMRKVRFFQRDAYISLDFLDKQAQIVRLYDEGSQPTDIDTLMELGTPAGKKFIHVDMPEIEPVNAIKLELATFAESILKDEAPRVPIEDGYQALLIADRIAREIAG